MVYLRTFLLILDAKCIYHTLDGLWVLKDHHFDGVFSWSSLAAQVVSGRTKEVMEDRSHCQVFRWFLRKPS